MNYWIFGLIYVLFVRLLVYVLLYGGVLVRGNDFDY